MPPRTRIPARREASGESASQPHDPLQKGRGRGRSQGRQGVNAARHGSAVGVANAEVVQQFVGVVAEQQQGNQQQNLDGQQGVRQVDQQPGAMAGGIEVTLAKFMKLKPPTFSESNANEDPQRFIDGLERLWRALGCSDIRAVELASFQLESVAYDWFNTVTRGRSVGSPSLAWGEFSRLFMVRFLPESVRDGLAHEFERLEQTERMSVSEYSAHFTQLSTHAPYPITEEMCVKRFIRGLREYIFRSVVGSNCSTFVEVLSLALQLEQRQKEKGNSGRDSRKKQRVEGSQSSHPSVGVGSVPGYQVQQRAVSQRGGSSGQSFGTTQSRRSDQGRFSRTTFPQRHFGVTSTPCPTCGRHHTGVYFGDSRAPSASVRQLGGSSGRGSGVAQQSGRGSGGRGQAQAGRGQARVFAITRQDAQASNAVVAGILCICSRDAHVLFDPGATHSFVSLSFATQLGKSPSSLDETLAVTTPVGEILLADCVYRSCVISIGGKELFANLIALDMVDFDVILGMDWLASHYATLDCHNKVVTFEMPGESAFSFQREQGWAPHNLISALGASKLLRKGCQGYLALVRDTQAVKPCPLSRGEKAFSQRISGAY
ncbi:Retrotransposon gag domain [Sesbania bispinosa]|nr:Retrotransposon gag domain [Sesbania bispinosa]